MANLTVIRSMETPVSSHSCILCHPSEAVDDQGWDGSVGDETVGFNGWIGLRVRREMPKCWNRTVVCSRHFS